MIHRKTNNIITIFFLEISIPCYGRLLALFSECIIFYCYKITFRGCKKMGNLGRLQVEEVCTCVAFVPRGSDPLWLHLLRCICSPITRAEHDKGDHT